MGDIDLTRKMLDLLSSAAEDICRTFANRIPEGAMRVAPGSDAVVWKISPEHSGEL